MSLQKAKFVTVKEKKTIYVQFNPSEYQIAANEPDGLTNQKLFDQKEEILTFTLYFDTYMGNGGLLGYVGNLKYIEDVRKYTDMVARLVERNENKNSLVMFIWGSLQFLGTVTSVNQKFTMFLDDGRPVRAILDVTMKSVSEAEKQVAFPSQSLLDNRANLVENVRTNKLDIGNVRTLLD